MKVPFLASLLLATATVHSFAQPANPTSANAVTAQWEHNNPNGGCYLATFSGSDSLTEASLNTWVQSGCQLYSETADFHSAFVSSSPTSGNFSYLYFGVNNEFDGTQGGESNTAAMVWPLEVNPGDEVVTDIWSFFEWDTSSGYAYGSMSTNSSGTGEVWIWGTPFENVQPVIWQNDDEHFYVTPYETDTGSLTAEEKRNYASDERLRTGGKAVPRRQCLFQLHVTAKTWAISEDPEDSSWDDVPSYWAGTAVPPGQIRMMGKQVGSDGNLYIVLPDGADLDAMPDVASQNYTALVTPTKYHCQFTAFVHMPDPPPGHRMHVGSDWGHAWWELITDAPTNQLVTHQLISIDELQYLNTTVGYGPVNSTNGYVLNGPGELPYSYNMGNSTVQTNYEIGFNNLIGALDYTFNIHTNPGTYNIIYNNCVEHVVAAGAAAGLALPDDVAPETFGYNLLGQGL
ncbi:MAG TPA: hypothetical protein VMB22_06840 [Verrucomicrobiae bacterium]|nr:hypothetical protein [Verrucomicrobiae bacterium]